MPIIIHLDHNFVRLYEYKTSELNLVAELLPEIKVLELANKFEPLWQKLWPEVISKADTIYFLINSNSSFTDSRIVFVWLQSWKMFTGKDFGMVQSGIILDLKRLNKNSLQEILDNTSFMNTSLDYAVEAKVTLK